MEHISWFFLCTQPEQQDRHLVPPESRWTNKLNGVKVSGPLLSTGWWGVYSPAGPSARFAPFDPRPPIRLFGALINTALEIKARGIEFNVPI
jgi:hypothetical protein